MIIAPLTLTNMDGQQVTLAGLRYQRKSITAKIHDLIYYCVYLSWVVSTEVAFSIKCYNTRSLDQNLYGIDRFKIA